MGGAHRQDEINKRKDKTIVNEEPTVQPEQKPAPQSIATRLLQSLDGKKTYIGIALMFLSYALNEHCRIWGIDPAIYTWINPLSDTLDWWGQVVLVLGGGHKAIKGKEFFQSLFDSLKLKKEAQTITQ